MIPLEEYKSLVQQRGKGKYGLQDFGGNRPGLKGGTKQGQERIRGDGSIICWTESVEDTGTECGKSGTEPEQMRAVSWGLVHQLHELLG